MKKFAEAPLSYSLALLLTVLGVSVAVSNREPANPTPSIRQYDDSAKQVALVVTAKGQGSASLFRRTNYYGNVRWFAWTAQHVIEGSDECVLKVFHRTEGRKVGFTVYTAKILKSSAVFDIALLYVDAPPNAFRPSVFADRSPMQRGEPIYHVGNFLGEEFEGSLSTGIISQVGIKNQDDRWPILDQTTAPIVPGSSGGPIFNYAGEVVGIVVARVEPTLNFFVPVRVVEGWASLNGLGWAVYGNTCPLDEVGKFLEPVPPKPVAPPEVPPVAPTPEPETFKDKNGNYVF